MHHRCRTRADDDSLEKIDVSSNRMSHCGFDRVGVLDAHDGFSGVLSAQLFDGGHHASLHFDETLA